MPFNLENYLPLSPVEKNVDGNKDNDWCYGILKKKGTQRKTSKIYIKCK